MSTTAGACRVLVTSAWFEPGFRGGGPIRSISRLIDTASDSIEIVLIAGDRDLGDVVPYLGLLDGPTVRGRALVHYVDPRSATAWWRLLRYLRRQQFELLYVNSLFDPRFTIAPLVVASLGLVRVKRMLIAPRGELSPGALSLKPGKKRLFLRFAQVLLRASHRIEWHASTTQEARHIRSSFPSAKIIIVADQTALPETATPPGTPNRGPIAMVFLSRISPKKNLDLVLRALRGVTAPAILDIFGPVEDQAYWESCATEIARLPSHLHVTYRGELSPADVRSTFAKYDVFVFPTRGENFGHVIAESMSVSCPVLASSETPWTAVLESGGGAVLADLSVDRLTRELQQLSAMAPLERHAMRRRVTVAYDDWRRATVDANVIDEWRDRQLEALGSGHPQKARAGGESALGRATS
jgi:glycosyltransferase involved in cell wall biosynthesis